MSTSIRRASCAATVAFVAAAALLLAAPTAARADHKVATWVGGNATWDDSANWDIGEVPANGVHTYDVIIPSGVTVTYDVAGPAAVTDLSLAAGSSLSVGPGRSLTVLADAAMGGVVYCTGGLFDAPAATSEITGNQARVQATDGATFALAAPAYSATGYKNGTYTLLYAQNAGTLLDLSSVTTLYDNYSEYYVTTHIIRAESGATIDLSGLETVYGPTHANANDRLDFIVSPGSDIRLDSLQSVTATGQVHFNVYVPSYTLPTLATTEQAVFVVDDACTLELPSLTAANRGGFTLGTGASANAPALVGLTGASLALDVGAHLNAPNVTNVEYSYLPYRSHYTITTAALTDIDNARFAVYDGLQVGTAWGDVAATTYSAAGLGGGHYTLFAAEGTGSVLDLSSLTVLNDNFNEYYERVHTVRAEAGGLVDLSNVETILGPIHGNANDRLDFLVGDTGDIRLDSLRDASASGGYLGWDVDRATYSLPALETLSRGRFEVAPAATLSLPSLLTHNGGSITVEAGGQVQAPSLTALNNVSVSLEDGAVFNAPSLVDFAYSTVTIDQNRTFTTGGLADIDNARIQVRGGEQYGAAWGDVTATTYSAAGLGGGHYTLFAAEGTGSVLDLSSLTVLNDNFNEYYERVHTVRAEAGGLVDLSNVETILGPIHGNANDRLDFLVGDTGDIRLDSLRDASASGGYLGWDVDRATYSLPALETLSRGRFEVAPAATLSLPSLLTHNGGSITVEAGGQVQAPSLTALNNVSVSLEDGAVFNAPSLVDFAYSTVTIDQNRTFTTGGLADIDNARIQVRGGEQYGAAWGDVAATTYSAAGLGGASYTLFSAEGAGSVLDLSSLTVLNDNYNQFSDRTHTVRAADGGTVDLSGVATIAGPTHHRRNDTLTFQIAPGGDINLDGLQSFSAEGYVRFDVDVPAYDLPALTSATAGVFDVADGSTLSLPALQTHSRGSYTLAPNATCTAPALTAMTGVSVSLEDGAHLDAPNLTNISSSAVTLDAGETFTTGAIAVLDNARVALRGGRTFGTAYGDVVADTYAATGLTGGNYTLFSAEGPGTVLDLSSLTVLNDGFSDYSGRVHTVTATAGATIDLSGVSSIQGPVHGNANDRLDLLVDAGATLRLDALQVVTSTSPVRLQATSGGRLVLGDLAVSNPLDLNVRDAGTQVDFLADFHLDAGGSVEVSAGAAADVAGDFTFEVADPARFDLDSGLLRFPASTSHLLEVGGEDLGLPAPGSHPTGNFGIGRLVVGDTGHLTRVELVDLVDNGNRTGGLSEALYLNGLGGPGGLEVLGGSALILGGINVYAMEAGAWVYLNGLFGPDQTVLPYGDGFIALGELGTAWDWDPAGANTWDQADAWTQGVPTVAFRAYVDNGGTAEITGATDPAVAEHLTVGRFASGHLHQTGGSLQVPGTLTLGYWVGSEGWLDCSGGTLEAGNLYVGHFGAGHLALTGAADVTVTGVLSLGNAGTLAAAPGATVHLAGTAFRNVSTTPAALADLAALAVVLEAGQATATDVEVAGRDLGADAAGWTMNFALGTLAVGGAAPGHLHLVDLHDNQPGWGGNEAMYVEALTIGPGAILDLAGLNLYYRNGGGTKRLYMGDCNLDGAVDTADYFEMAAHWFDAAGWAGGDFNGDGVVDTADYFELAANWFETTPGGAAPTPEPATLALVLAGAALAAGRKQKR